MEISEPTIFRTYARDNYLPLLTPTYRIDLFLVLLQITDAYLTALGVSRFGLESEGNPLLRPMMEQFGHIPVLLCVKTMAILCIFMLAQAATRVRWVPKALGAMSCFYFFVAILPWAYFLIFDPLS